MSKIQNGTKMQDGKSFVRN